MKNRFFISDTHFDHANILKFEAANGKPVREFASVEEMNETMIERWNAVVKPEDTVYHLGDVAISKKGLVHLARLNGRKILVKGNHDIFKLKDYVEHFKDIRSCVVRPGESMIFSHIPIHMGELGRFKINVHGHLHSNVVMTENVHEGIIPDPRYISVCVEQVNYTPVHLDELMAQAAKVA